MAYVIATILSMSADLAEAALCPHLLRERYRSLRQSTIHDEGQGFKDEGTGMEKEEDAAPAVSCLESDKEIDCTFEGLGKSFEVVFREGGEFRVGNRRERENHDLRRQLAKERRERLELTGRVARMERRQELEGGSE
ncbi:hypothetical protein Tco_1337565 [Tanacetum coccineum]